MPLDHPLARLLVDVHMQAVFLVPLVPAQMDRAAASTVTNAIGAATYTDMVVGLHSGAANTVTRLFTLLHRAPGGLAKCVEAALAGAAVALPPVPRLQLWHSIVIALRRVMHAEGLRGIHAILFGQGPMPPAVLTGATPGAEQKQNSSHFAFHTFYHLAELASNLAVLIEAAHTADRRRLRSSFCSQNEWGGGGAVGPNRALLSAQRLMMNIVQTMRLIIPLLPDTTSYAHLLTPPLAVVCDHACGHDAWTAACRDAGMNPGVVYNALLEMKKTVQRVQRK